MQEPRRADALLACWEDLMVRCGRRAREEGESYRLPPLPGQDPMPGALRRAA